MAAWFLWYVKKYQVGKFFHAVRLHSNGRPPTLPLEEPLIIFLNHPSWWDPLICVVASELFPGRNHYAPIEAAMLAKYRIFSKLGFFGIDPGPRGAIQFLRTGLTILKTPATLLWVTAQGEFRDARVRPPGLMRGLGKLLARHPRATVLPLALEYPFWNERKPEAHLSFGPPLTVASPAGDAGDWSNRLENALVSAQDQLADASISRDPERFETLVRGRSGVGGVYDLWRGLKARFRGEHFHAGHGPTAT